MSVRVLRVVEQLAHVGANVSLTQQLEERLGDGQVHQPVVLDALGQEHSQEEEEFSDPVQVVAVLRERRWKQSTRPLDVEAWRF